MDLVELRDYFEMMEVQLSWEKKGFVLNWTAVLGPTQGVEIGHRCLGLVSRWANSSPSAPRGRKAGRGSLTSTECSLVKVLAEPVVDAAWKRDGSAIAAVSKVDEDGLRRLECHSDWDEPCS